MVWMNKADDIGDGQGRIELCGTAGIINGLCVYAGGHWHRDERQLGPVWVTRRGRWRGRQRGAACLRSLSRPGRGIRNGSRERSGRGVSGRAHPGGTITRAAARFALPLRDRVLHDDFRFVFGRGRLQARPLRLLRKRREM